MPNSCRTPTHSLSLRKSQLLESLRAGIIYFFSFSHKNHKFLCLLLTIFFAKVSLASPLDINKNLEQSLRQDQNTYNQIEKTYDQALKRGKASKNKKQFENLVSIQLLKAKIEIQKRILIKLGSEPLNIKDWQITLEDHLKDLLKQERQFENSNQNIESGLLALIELLNSPNLSQQKYFLLTRRSLSYSKTHLANQLKNYDYSHREGGVMVRPQSEKYNVGLHIEGRHLQPRTPLSRELSSLKKTKGFELKNLFQPLRHNSNKKNSLKKVRIKK